MQRNVIASSVTNGPLTYANILAGLCPAGSIIYSANPTPPTGYLVCNGASLAVASYPTLFSVIGYTFGGGGANFSLPGAQSMFIRGRDNMGTGARGIDAARPFGDVQSQDFQSHNHPASASVSSEASHGHSGSGSMSGSGDHSNGHSKIYAWTQYSFSPLNSPEFISGNNSGGSFHTDSPSHSHSTSGNTDSGSSTHNHGHSFSADASGTGGNDGTKPRNVAFHAMIKY